MSLEWIVSRMRELMQIECKRVLRKASGKAVGFSIRFQVKFSEFVHVILKQMGIHGKTTRKLMENCINVHILNF